MRKKGFTLLELLIVVVIIGILATFAVPQFLKATERAKLGKGQNTLSLISQGLKMYYGDKGKFTAAIGDLDDYVEIDSQQAADNDWNYSISLGASGTGAFDVKAVREGTGTYAGNNVTLDETNAWTGNHGLLP